MGDGYTVIASPNVDSGVYIFSSDDRIGAVSAVGGLLDPPCLHFAVIRPPFLEAKTIMFDLVGQPSQPTVSIGFIFATYKLV